MQQGGRRPMIAPKRPAIRRIPPGAPRQTTFPAGSGPELGREDDAEVSQPAASAPPISHVTRRRSAPPPEAGSSSNVADFAGAGADDDGIGFLAGSPDEDSRTMRRALAAPPSSVAAPLVSPPAALPVAAVDVAPPAGAHWRERALILAGTVLTLVAGIGIGVALRPSRAHVDPPPPIAVAPAPPPAPVSPPAPLLEVTPPRPSVGTVVGAEGHRLWVDGHLAEGFTTVVSCGHHLVQVGSAGTPRDVDVPCGQAITVSR